MNFEHSDKVKALARQVQAFMDEHVYPAESVYEEQVQASRWEQPRVMEELKERAHKDGLWNLFLPESGYGAGLTNLEYAPLCEIMGRSAIGPEAFNCAAPGAAWMMDTVGNKVARKDIAMIKVSAPNAVQQVIDWAIQAHGAAGVCEDFGLARMFALNRTLRLADGPDEVHRNQIARLELREH